VCLNASWLGRTLEKSPGLDSLCNELCIADAGACASEKDKQHSAARVQVAKRADPMDT